jgi:hypothetical protein
LPPAAALLNLLPREPQRRGQRIHRRGQLAHLGAKRAKIPAMHGQDFGLIPARCQQRRAPRPLDDRFFAIEGFGQDLGRARPRRAEFAELLPAAIAIPRQAGKVQRQHRQQ